MSSPSASSDPSHSSKSEEKKNHSATPKAVEELRQALEKKPNRPFVQVDSAKLATRVANELPPKDDPYYKTPEACKELSKLHERCFMRWYQEEFLPGKGSVRKVGCEVEFKAYQKCMKYKLEAIGIDVEKELGKEQ